MVAIPGRARPYAGIEQRANFRQGRGFPQLGQRREKVFALGRLAADEGIIDFFQQHPRRARENDEGGTAVIPLPDHYVPRLESAQPRIVQQDVP